MNPNQLENIIKEKYNQDTRVPNMDALWSSIAPELKKEKRRRALLWWWCGLALIIIVGASSILLKSHDGKIDPMIEKSSLVENEEKSTEPTITNVKDELVSTDNHNSVDNDARVNSEPVMSESFLTSQNQQVLASNFTPVASIQDRFFNTNETVVSIQDVTESVSHSIQRKARDLLWIENIEGFRIRPFLKDREALILPTAFANENVLLDNKSKIIFAHGLRFSLGYGLSRQSLGIQNGIGQSILNHRMSTERALDAIQAQLEYRWYMGKHWSIASGLQLDVITVETVHQFENSSIVELQDTTATVTNSSGETYAIVENVSAVETVNTRKTRYNYYTSLSIPLTLRYRHGFGKWSTELGIGVSTSIWSKNTGFIQNEDNSEYPLNQDEDMLFKSRWYYQGAVELGLSYKMRTDLNWHIGLKSQIGLNNLGTSSNPISQKFNLFNLQSGVDYRF